MTSEILSQPVKPRMMHITHRRIYCWIDFLRARPKVGHSVTSLGELIVDHCKKLEELLLFTLGVKFLAPITQSLVASARNFVIRLNVIALCAVAVIMIHLYSRLF